MLPYKQSYFRMIYENKFCYRIIYRIIFESIVFTYYIKSNGSLLIAHFALLRSLCASLIAFIINGQDEQEKI